MRPHTAAAVYRAITRGYTTTRYALGEVRSYFTRFGSCNKMCTRDRRQRVVVVYSNQLQSESRAMLHQSIHVLYVQYNMYSSVGKLITINNNNDNYRHCVFWFGKTSRLKRKIEEKILFLQYYNIWLRAIVRRVAVRAVRTGLCATTINNNNKNKIEKNMIRLATRRLLRPRVPGIKNVLR